MVDFVEVDAGEVAVVELEGGMLNVDYERLLLIPREGKIKSRRKRRRRVGSGKSGQEEKDMRGGGTRRKE